jgi:hypothetical protein
MHGVPRLRNRVRISALLAVLALQLCGGFAVLCNEGAELVLEFLPGSCCDGGGALAEAGAARSSGSESCGDCQDAPVATLSHRDPDAETWKLPLPASGCEWTPDRDEPPRGRTVGSPALRGAPHPPVPLVGTIVLVC